MRTVKTACDACGELECWCGGVRARRRDGAARVARTMRFAGFCDACTDVSTPETSGDIWHYRFVGTLFIGKSDYCGKCRSYTRTVFAIALLPLFPVGSYRVREIGFSLDQRRRTIQTRGVPLVMRQVLIGYGLTLGVLTLMAVAGVIGFIYQ